MPVITHPSSPNHAERCVLNQSSIVHPIGYQCNLHLCLVPAVIASQARRTTFGGFGGWSAMLIRLIGSYAK